MSQKLKLKEQKQPEIVIHKLSPVHGSESVVLCLPKKQIQRLNLKKNDYVKCSIVDGSKLLVEKLEYQ